MRFATLGGDTGDLGQGAVSVSFFEEVAICRMVLSGARMPPP
ncbi:hypothetical protein [Nocardiopsis sp. CA-288880]